MIQWCAKLIVKMLRFLQCNSDQDVYEYLLMVAIPYLDSEKTIFKENYSTYFSLARDGI